VNYGVLLELQKFSSATNLLEFAKESFTKLPDIAKKYWPIIILDLAFVLFVCQNGGIVVGDRTAHIASLHFMQLFYLATTLVAFFPSNFSKLSKPNYIFLGILLCVNAAAWQIRVEHLYLISDNRHFTFYLWRYIQAFSPVFLVISTLCAYIVLSPLNLSTQLWLMCTAAVLVPAPLIEPRYFIVPVAAWAMIGLPQPSSERRFAVGALNVAATLMMTGLYKGVKFIW